jgi:hypothetical protein
VWGKQVVYYEYKDAHDLKGQIKKKETAAKEK